MELGVSPEMGWQIVCDDAAYQHWHPEVTNIEWYDEEKSGRTIVFKDLLLMILLAGPVKVWEAIDVWEKEGPVKRFSFYISHQNRLAIFVDTRAHS